MIQRWFPWAVSVIAALSVAISLATEGWLQWRPCYLCITQRTVFAVLVLTGLAWGLGSRLGWWASALLALAGASVAATQLYVQYTASSAVCGGGMPNRLESSIEWLAEHVGSFFAVTGFCTDPYPVLGVPMAGWAVLLFTGFFGLAISRQKL